MKRTGHIRGSISSHRALLAVAAAGTCWSLAVPAGAQCSPAWSADFSVPGLPTPSCSVQFDDGTGPALYAGGFGARAGGRLCRGVARFDGQDWRPVAGGIQASGALIPAAPRINVMAVFDVDGTGPNPAELFVAGGPGGAVQSDGNVLPINFMFRWNGSSWGEAGINFNNQVLCMATMDGPDGPRLYVGGAFTGRLVFLDSTGWNTVVNTRLLGNGVFALAAFDEDGPGPAPVRMYVLGAGSQQVVRLSESGDAVEFMPIPQPPVEPEIFPQAFGLTAYDPDGAGPQAPKLCVGGAGWVQTWDGSAWGILPFQIPDYNAISVLQPIDLGDGPRLYLSGGQPHVWDGAAVRELGTGISLSYGAQGPDVTSVSTFCQTTLRGTPVVFVGGNFNQAGDVPALNSGFFDGAAWRPQLTRKALGVGGLAVQIAPPVDLDGEGPRPARPLAFSIAPDSAPVVTAEVATENGVLAFDGQRWAPTDLPGIPGAFSKFIRYNPGDGSGEALYCVGQAGNTEDGESILQIWRLDGSGWTGVASGYIGCLPQAVAVFDPDGPGPQRPLLVVGGLAGNPNGAFTGIIAWDGQQYQQIGAGAFTPGSSNVNTLVVFDDGSGVKLYASVFNPNGPSAGPSFDTVLRYDGSSWQAIANNTTSGSNLVIGSPLRIMDIGAGPGLYAGALSAFDGLNRASADFALFRWTGSGWSEAVGRSTLTQPVGNAAQRPYVSQMIGFDDGSGAALHVCGLFGGIDGGGERLVAKRAAFGWEGLGTVQLAELDSNARAVATNMFVFDEDGSGPGRAGLYVVGNFDNAEGQYVSTIARWGCPGAPACPLDVNHDGFVDPDDLSDFIGCYFLQVTTPGSCPAADLDGSGTTDPDDLADFIGAYFTGC